MNRFVNKTRSVDVFYKKVFIKLTKSDFEMLWNKKMQGMTDFIEPKKAIAFIERINTAKITKDELDDERVYEINGLDMMQNQSIIYHSESIMEL